MSNREKHLSHIIALRERAKNIENTLRLSGILDKYKNLTLSQTLDKYKAATEARQLYKQAFRIAELLKSTAHDEEKHDLERLSHMIASDLRRLNDALKILAHKARKWGFSTEDLNGDEAFMPSKSELEPEAFKDIDLTAADDKYETYLTDDALKAEVKASLKALMDVVDYMERASLLKIRKDLIDKFSAY